MRVEHCQAAGIDMTYRVVDDVKGGPTLVFLGGLGGTHLIWSGLVRLLRDRYRILIWDYPGLLAGEALSPDAQIDVPSLAGYLEEVLKKDGTDSVCRVGWSLGVQVGIEFAGVRSGGVAALVAVCGIAGKPFMEDAEDDPILSVISRGKSLPQALGWLSKRLERIDAMRDALYEIEKPTKWAKRLGLVDPRTDELVFDAVIRDFLKLDVAVYNRYAVASADHDASHVLGGLAFPVLAVAGERDRFIKPARIKKMADRIPRSEYFEIRGATHYLPLEYGDVLSLKIDEFLKGSL
jgi:pimeloyl-ACP methyl ester carboxylesterase